MANPAELSLAEQQRGDGGADLGIPQSVDVLVFGLYTLNQTNEHQHYNKAVERSQ